MLQIGLRLLRQERPHRRVGFGQIRRSRAHAKHPEGHRIPGLLRQVQSQHPLCPCHTAKGGALPKQPCQAAVRHPVYEAIGLLPVGDFLQNQLGASPLAFKIRNIPHVGPPFSHIIPHNGHKRKNFLRKFLNGEQKSTFCPLTEDAFLQYLLMLIWPSQQTSA